MHKLVAPPPSLAPVARASASNDAPISADAEYDLIIIGSGPAALALLTRLLEERPAALYTEDERRHLSWLTINGTSGGGNDALSRGRTALKTYRSRQGVHIKAHDKADICTRLLRRCACPRVLVIDKLGGWLSGWKNAFKAFDIQYLRSPMFWHPSPSGLDDLLTYAERTGKNVLGHPSYIYGETRGPSSSSPKHKSKPDMIEICGVVGKEVTKHRKKKQQRQKAMGGGGSTLGININERHREDYFTPSQDLFLDFCQDDVIDRYGIPGGGTEPWPTLRESLQKTDHTCHQPELTVAKAEAQMLEWHDDGRCVCGEQDRGFVLRLSTGETVTAKAVVSAVGPGGVPAVPSVLKPLPNMPSEGRGWCHSSVLARPGFVFPPAHLHGKRDSVLLIVGGGLTSAQITDKALRNSSFDKVILLLRGHLKVKPFDVGNEWMGKYSNIHKMAFWQEDDPAARVQMLKDARQGGSVTPTYAKVLANWEERGRLQIMRFTEFKKYKWLEEEQQCQVQLLTTEKVSVAKDVTETVQREQTINVDYIVAGTGARWDFPNLPLLRDINAKHAIPEYGGLPCSRRTCSGPMTSPSSCSVLRRRCRSVPLLSTSAASARPPTASQAGWRSFPSARATARPRARRRARRQVSRWPRRSTTGRSPLRISGSRRFPQRVERVKLPFHVHVRSIDDDQRRE